MTARAMDAADAEEYTQALGQIVAGSWRQIALADRLGVPEALGLSTREWVELHLGGYVKLSIPERREAALELVAEGMTQREAAAAIGVHEATVSRDLADASDGVGDASNYAVDEPSPLANATGKAEAAAETRSRRDVSRAAPELDDGFELRQGDARDVLADVPDSSVPLVLTDPPYGDESEPLYRWLAEWSARVLIPGGSLIVYTGQSRFDRDMRIFGERLRYWWLLSMMHTRSQRLPGKFVMAEFKPVLWYVRDYRRGKALVNDVLRPRPMDADAPVWAQGEAGVGFLVEQLTDPGERIVDPFAGTGEWGRIAAGMGRRWLGADVADEHERAAGVIVV